MAQEAPTYGWDAVLHEPYVQRELLLSLAILFLFLALGYVVRYTFGWYADKVAAKTDTEIDDFIMAAIHPPAVLIFLTVGFWLAFRRASAVMPVFFATEVVFFAIMVLLVAYTAGRVVKAALVHHAKRRPRAVALSQVGSRIAYLLAFTIGSLIILRSLGVEITPLLTSLGIAGLAVALALQDTLSNMFAGFYIQTSRTIRPGDYIRIEDINQEGWVVDVNWRTTRIRTRPNHMIAIPNTRLANSVISNYELPQAEQAAVLEVGVSYRSDPEQVERILKAQGDQALQELPQIVKSFEPIVRFGGFGDSSLNFLLIVRVNHYLDQFLVLHTLRHRVFKAFAAEGIEIPFPHRTLYLRQEDEERPFRFRNVP